MVYFMFDLKTIKHYWFL